MAKVIKKGIDPKDTLQKKQWSKFVSKGIALSLMHYNPDSQLFKSYKNSSYCNEVIRTNDVGKATSTYCKNRWCMTCNRIKTAMCINGYLPELEKLFEPVFVTLTLPTVQGSELPKRIAEMEKTWREIAKLAQKSKYKKTHSPFKGIRKAECTIRPNGYYHYHFHFILDTWASGEWLINQWMKRFPKAGSEGQHLRFADEFSFRELFKYAFKAEVKTDNSANAKRYDVVFKALHKKRTYQPFGGIKKVNEELEDDLFSQTTLENLCNRLFKWVQDDWYDTSSGEALIGLAIPEKVKSMVSYPDEPNNQKNLDNEKK